MSVLEGLLINHFVNVLVLADLLTNHFVNVLVFVGLNARFSGPFN